MEKETTIKRILILEDNPVVLSNIAFLLQKLEQKSFVHFFPISFPTAKEASTYLEHHPEPFDIILLDKNDKSGGSYHTLNLEKLGPSKIISMSSVPGSNNEAKMRGVTKIALKRYDDLDRFIQNLESELLKLLQE